MLPSRGRLVGENMQQRLPHESIDNVGKHVFFVFLGTFSFYRNGTSNRMVEMPINTGRACSFRAQYGFRSSPSEEQLYIIRYRARAVFLRMGLTSSIPRSKE